MKEAAGRSGAGEAPVGMGDGGGGEKEWSSEAVLIVAPIGGGVDGGGELSTSSPKKKKWVAAISSKLADSGVGGVKGRCGGEGCRRMRAPGGLL